MTSRGTTAEERFEKRKAARADALPRLRMQALHVSTFRSVGQGTLDALRRARIRRKCSMDVLLFGLHQHALRTGWL